VNHEAGLDGRGGSSYIDLVACVNQDLSSAWTSASDGVLETRRYYCQNWRADVVALVSSSGWMLEQDRYSSYGVPLGLPGGDTNSDGDCDSADSTQIQTWINGSVYDIRGDVNLDGVVDATDKSRVDSAYIGVTLGWSTIGAFGNRKGFAGIESDAVVLPQYHSRHRLLLSALGIWSSRDALTTGSEQNAYAFADSRPITNVDPLGLATWPISCGEQIATSYSTTFSTVDAAPGSAGTACAQSLFNKFLASNHPYCTGCDESEMGCQQSNKVYWTGMPGHLYGNTWDCSSVHLIIIISCGECESNPPPDPPTIYEPFSGGSEGTRHHPEPPAQPEPPPGPTTGGPTSGGVETPDMRKICVPLPFLPGCILCKQGHSIWITCDAIPIKPPSAH